MIRRKNRGFGMIEMLAVLMMLTAFSLVAARVFTQSVGQLREVPKAANEMAAIEQIREMLGKDVWNAVDIRTPSDDLLVLIDSRGELVTWQLMSDEHLSRITLTQTNIWAELTNLHFVNAETGVSLSQGKRAWTFICPIKLAGRHS